MIWRGVTGLPAPADAGPSTINVFGDLLVYTCQPFVSDFDQIYTSIDGGETWVGRGNPFGDIPELGPFSYPVVNGVAKLASGVYVLAGWNSDLTRGIAVTEDFTTYTLIDTGDADQEGVKVVCSADGSLVVVRGTFLPDGGGTSRSLLWSSDGSTWNDVTDPPYDESADTVLDITEVPERGKWVAVVSTGSLYVADDPTDGTTWTAVANPFPPDGNPLYAAWCPVAGKAAALGYHPSTGTEIATSTDLSAFVGVGSPFDSDAGASPYAVIELPDGTIYVGGDPFDAGSAGLVKSTDGADSFELYGPGIAVDGFCGVYWFAYQESIGRLFAVTNVASIGGTSYGLIYLGEGEPPPPPPPPPPPAAPAGIWTFELCDQVDVVLADVTGFVTATISPRLNRPFSLVLNAPADQDVWKTIHTDGDRYLAEGIRTIKAKRNGVLVANVEIWRLDYAGDENGQRVQITCFDSMVRSTARTVRDVDGRLSEWHFTDPLVAGPFVKALFANSIVWDDEDVPDGTPRVFPIDAVSGAFTADCDVTDDYADGPMMLGDLLYRTICDVGLADIMLAPTDTDHGSDPGIYGILHCVTHWGSDLHASVHFDYGTGANNLKAVRRSFDMATVTNRLRYFIGPQLRPSYWTGQIEATDPEFAGLGYRDLQAASRAKYGTLRSFSVFDSSANAILELYRALWKVEDTLRVNPRQLLYVTPAGNCAYEPFEDYNVGDLVGVNIGDDVGPASAGMQRIYGMDVSVDVNGVEVPGELIVSPDGAGFTA